MSVLTDTVTTMSRGLNGPVTVYHDGTYCSLPTMARAANRDIYAIWRTAPVETGNGHFLLSKSTDNGLTWSDPTITLTNILDLRDPALLILPNGTWLLTYDTYVQATDTALAYCAKSMDKGLTWSTPVRTSAFTGNFNATTTDPVIIDNNVLLLACYGKDIGQTYYSCRVYTSSDYGDSWDYLSEITGQGETVIRKLANGNLLAMGRGDPDGFFYASTSDDNGATWKDKHEALRNVSGRPNFIQITSGKLICAGRNLYDAYTKSHFISEDNGYTWSANMDRTVGSSHVRGYKDVSAGNWMYSAFIEVYPNVVAEIFAQAVGEFSNIYCSIISPGCGLPPYPNLQTETIYNRGILRSDGLILTRASTVDGAGLRIPPGVAPTSPIDGYVWYDGTDIYFRVGNVSKKLAWA